MPPGWAVSELRGVTFLPGFKRKILGQEPPADRGSSSRSEFKVCLKGWEYQDLDAWHKSALGFTGRVDSAGNKCAGCRVPSGGFSLPIHQRET